MPSSGPPVIDGVADFRVCGFGTDFQHGGHLIEAFAAEAELTLLTMPESHSQPFRSSEPLDQLKQDNRWVAWRFWVRNMLWRLYYYQRTCYLILNSKYPSGDFFAVSCAL